MKTFVEIKRTAVDQVIIKFKLYFKLMLNVKLHWRVTFLGKLFNMLYCCFQSLVKLHCTVTYYLVTENGEHLEKSFYRKYKQKTCRMIKQVKFFVN